MPIQLIIRNPLDRDAREYIQRAGVSDAAARSQLNEFVRGVKALGLWNNMVCWPLRSSQNAGTGTTAYSLGGLGGFNATLVNGPTWGTLGVSLDRSLSAGITISSNLANIIGTQDCSIFCIVDRNNSTADNIYLTQIAGATAAAFYGGIGMNLGSSVGTFPRTTRGGSNYFHANRGGAVAAGMQAHYCTLLSTSQASYRSGVLISNETGLSARNATGSATSSFIANTGNVGTGSTIHAMSSIILQGLSGTNFQGLYNLYKNTLGSGLGLP
jgi:hypothetical protein